MYSPFYPITIGGAYFVFFVLSLSLPVLMHCSSVYDQPNYPLLFFWFHEHLFGIAQTPDTFPMHI